MKLHFLALFAIVAVASVATPVFAEDAGVSAQCKAFGEAALKAKGTPAYSKVQADAKAAGCFQSGQNMPQAQPQMPAGVSAQCKAFGEAALKAKGTPAYSKVQADAKAAGCFQ